MSETLVVNLFAGPGVGKSTNAALVFGKLKTQGITAELVTEYAKDLVWEERHQALGFQPYILAKQMWHIHRLLGKVPVIITDSPILFGLIYGADGYGDAWKAHILEVFSSWNNLNINLLRDEKHHAYVAEGRTQKTVQEAEVIDEKVWDLLYDNHIPHERVHLEEGEITAEKIVILIRDRLKEQNG